MSLLRLAVVVKSFPSFRNVLVASTLIRIALILYSEWHDARSTIKYTDVDYRVFTDAARFLWQPTVASRAEGPLSQWAHVGKQVANVFSPLMVSNSDYSPYSRTTYRYTPLLAVIMTPNIWLHISFGKYLFAMCDIINGIIIRNLLVAHVLNPRPVRRSSGASQSKSVSPRRNRQLTDVQEMATFLSSMHLMNPMVFAISTRGSSEAILCTLVLLTLSYLLSKRWNAAAILLGVSVHWKIYPVIYGFSCVTVIGSLTRARNSHPSANLSFRTYLNTIINRHTIQFAVLSSVTFLVLGIACYLV